MLISCPCGNTDKHVAFTKRDVTVIIGASINTIQKASGIDCSGCNQILLSSEYQRIYNQFKRIANANAIKYPALIKLDPLDQEDYSLVC